MAAWESYAAPLSVTIPPDPEQIDAWWQSVRPPLAPLAKGL
jgi:hypothetical protein